VENLPNENIDHYIASDEGSVAALTLAKAVQRNLLAIYRSTILCI
jgi:hypothetical protein